MRCRYALEAVSLILLVVCAEAQVTSLDFRPHVLLAHPSRQLASWSATDTLTQVGLDSSQKSVQWMGVHVANYTGPFNFSLVSDDASYLWLGVVAISGYSPTNALVQLNGTGLQQQSATTWLSEGEEYLIRIQYGNNADYANMTAKMNDGDLASACTSLVDYLDMVAVGSNGDLAAYPYSQSTDGNLLTGWVGAAASPRIDFDFRGATVSLGRIHFVMGGESADWFASVTFIINNEVYARNTSCADGTQTFDFDMLLTSEVTMVLGELCFTDDIRRVSPSTSEASSTLV
jgi:hypothetical protein